MSKKNLKLNLEQACQGLVFISEIDADVVPVLGPVCDKITPEIVLTLTDRDTPDPIEERGAEDFFQRLTAVKEWHGDVQKERAKRFQELFVLLKENLRHLKVFRVGSVRIDIYVLGLDDDGRITGVRTAAVET